MGRPQRRHRDSVHVGRGRCVAQRLHRRAGYRRYVRRTELRDWTVVFRGVAPVDAASGVRAWSGEAPVEATVAYDEATMSLTVSVTGISSAASLRIEIPGGLRIADNPVESDAMDLLLHAQMLYRTKELALQAVHKLGIGAIGALRTMNRGPRYANDFWITDMPDAVAGALEEILLRS